MNRLMLMEVYLDLIEKKTGKDLTPERICTIFAEDFGIQITPQELLALDSLPEETRDLLIHNRLVELRYG